MPVVTRQTAIRPTRAEDYAQWYQQLVRAADLAEPAPVRGCMVIKPWGYGIWEKIQRYLDRQLKQRGHENAYFPLLIPLSALQREAEHVEGFAKECAVVTHHCLAQGDDGQLVAAAPLPEPLIVRPTSEMMIGQMFARWIRSYRDLPCSVNQWANVVRWELRPRLLLRSAEFLWQEGHTVHATREEAVAEAEQILQLYRCLCQDLLAIPVIAGCKSSRERFPGAEITYTLEAMMQDRKALQMGTSHFLGQNFARSCGIKFHDRRGQEVYGWTTSWGVSTRLLGALCMTHGDDDGLILPPRAAAKQLVILPILRGDSDDAAVLSCCRQLQQQLQQLFYHDDFLSVVVDSSAASGGEKKWAWIKKGIPLRLEIGARDLAAGEFIVQRRDRPAPLRWTLPQLRENICQLLDAMQSDLFARAAAFCQRHTKEIATLSQLQSFFATGGGFARCHLASQPGNAAALDQLGLTVRCIPFDQDPCAGSCVLSGCPSQQQAILARGY